MLSFKIEMISDTQMVYFYGPIDENVSPVLSELKDRLDFDYPIGFDLSGVLYVSSLGLRYWVNFARQTQEFRQIEIHKCPAELINLASVIPHFFGRWSVVSVLVDLDCSECSYESQTILTGAEKDESAASDHAVLACEGCGHSVTVDLDLELLSS